MNYTTAWVNELQATSAADQAHRQFGWTNEDGDSFVLGNQEVFKDRVSSTRRPRRQPDCLPLSSLEARWRSGRRL